MRHGCKFNKLSRAPHRRIRLLLNLTTSLFLHERIHTTVPRAKVLRSHAERLITLVAHRNPSPQIDAKLKENISMSKVVEKVKNVLAERYRDRPGGYTRIMRLGPRRNKDRADVALVELVDNPFDIRQSLKKLADLNAHKFNVAKYPEPHKPLNRPLLK